MQKSCILTTCKNLANFVDCSCRLEVTLNDFSNVHISGLLAVCLLMYVTCSLISGPGNLISLGAVLINIPI